MIDQARATELARQIVEAYRTGDIKTAEAVLQSEPFRELCIDLGCSISYARRMLQHQAAQHNRPRSG